MRTIVIDPGHGGQDAGVHGASGTLEKDVTISVARRVKAAIEGRIGLRVLLTRNGDQAVASDDRASVANNNKADLFLSLHANASLQHQLKGAEVFYLDADSYGEEPKKLPPAGAGERLPVVGGGTREIELIPWELAQTRYVEQSGLLARDIEEQMRGRVLLAPLPIEQAPLRALVGASMPAVLVEMGFLSNPEQEQQLASSDYQNTIAQALVDAIVHFRDDLERARAGLAYQTSAAGRRPRLPER
jgi:N-acetylmuramoyl-L-alanine amidase